MRCKCENENDLVLKVWHLCRLVVLSVVENEKRNPKLVNIFQRQRILRSGFLQVQVFDTVVVPSNIVRASHGK